MNKLEYSRKFGISSFNVDFKGQATVLALLQFLEEIGWEHARHLDLGFSELLKQNLMWVLLRLKIKINKFPNWQDTVRIKTWAAGKDNLFWYRDYKIYDANNNELARATSTFIIINTATRRPHRADNMFNVKIAVEERSFEEKLGKLPGVNDKNIRYKKEIHYSDLDLNDHVNNVKYVEWVLDSYPLPFFKKNTVNTLEVNYLAEANYGDTVMIKSDSQNLSHLHSIERESDNKELFKAKIQWTKGRRD